MASGELTIQDLNDAAAAVIDDLKTFPEYSKHYLGICGGLAVAYYTGHRVTQACLLFPCARFYFT
jgi:hypothetical protein